jgi:RNA polymerase sigma-70 factor, ECF subfamily
MPSVSNDLISALPRLRRYARILTGDPERADELVRLTLNRTRQIEQGAPSGDASLGPLLSILRSVYADHYAPGQARGQVSSVVAREKGPSAIAVTIGNARASNVQPPDELLARLWRLPVEDREVLVLVAVERMSYSDVADLLAVPVATVLARLTQARALLRSGGSDGLTAPKSAG